MLFVLHCSSNHEQKFNSLVKPNMTRKKDQDDLKNLV